MADKASNVVLNFKMNGQVQYAQTLKQINMVMSTASKEYQNHVLALGKDASATEKLTAEKKKLETQLAASSKKVEMLRGEFEAMQNDTTATADDLQKLYNQVLAAENAHTKLENAMKKVEVGLSEESISSREAKDELKNLSDEMKVLESEQKKLTSSFELQNATLDENASEAEKALLSQKQYAQQMELTQKVIGTLEKQLDQAKKAYGENSKEVNELETKLNQAKGTVAKFSRELESVDENAEKAEKGLDGLGGGLETLAGAIPAAAIAGLVEGMQETNIQLAMLETQAVNAGLSLEEIGKARAIFATVNQDVGQVTEAIGNLTQAGYTSEESLTSIAEGIAGAISSYGETFNAEGLAESIATTTALGEVTGQFMDLLEKENINVEDFNAVLQSMSSEQERANFITQAFAKEGLNDAYEAYRKANPEIVANAEAQLALTDQTSQLSVVLTPLVTKVAEFTTKLIEWANENPKLVTTLAVVGMAIGAIVTAVSVLSPIIGALIPLFAEAGLSIGAVAGPIGIAIAAIGLIVAALVTAYTQSETFRTKVNEVFGGIQDIIQTVIGFVVSYLQEKLAQIQQFWSENGDQILAALENLKNGAMAVFNFLLPFLQALVMDFIGAIKNVIDGGLNVILGLVKVFSSLLTGDFSGMWDGIKQMFSGAVELLWGILQLGFLGKIVKIFKTFGDDAVKFITDMVSKSKGKFDDLLSNAKSKFDAIKNAIMTPINKARDAVKAAIDKIKSIMDFDWKLPKLKLPHISVKGSFDLNPMDGDGVSVPKFNIDWRAKGAIFTQPTIFGAYGGRLQGAGDAGPEAALPLNESTLGAIGRGIAATMPEKIVVQSILDGKVIAESTSKIQFSKTNINALTKGVPL